MALVATCEKGRHSCYTPSAPGEPINYHIAEARDLLALGVKRGQMFGTFAGTKDWTDSWPAKRQKIADGLERIRHWDIRLGNYYQIPNYEATWFIDPPYQGINGYNHRFQHYDDLATWCRSRRGQVIVCEREGATWLPFRSMNYLKRTSISNKPQKRLFGPTNHVESFFLETERKPKRYSYLCPPEIN